MTTPNVEEGVRMLAESFWEAEGDDKEPALAALVAAIRADLEARLQDEKDRHLATGHELIRVSAEARRCHS